MTWIKAWAIRTCQKSHRQASSCAHRFGRLEPSLSGSDPPVPYNFAKTLDTDLPTAVARVRSVLAEEGFGVVSEIDIGQTLRAKLGVAFRPYVILGACNPVLAHEALKLENKVGAMLPCNVVVQAVASRRSEVAAIDPVASMQAIDNPELKLKAEQVAAKLRSVINRL